MERKAPAVCGQRVMDNDEDDLNHSRSIESKPTIAYQDDQIKTSPMNNNRRRVRVKFAYSFDNDRVLPIKQTTVIETEPCFKVTATEDEAAKHFYLNKSNEHKKAQSIRQRTLSEQDSLDDDYPPQLVKEKEITSKSIDAEDSVAHRTSSVPLKSILKKPQKKEEVKSRSPSPSPSSSIKKQRSIERLNFNDVQYLAELTAKQNLPSPSIYTRSLFDQTINIFNPNNSYRITSTNPRPSRFQYYIKPYRGEPEVPTHKNKQRSKSLPQQSKRTTRWDTFSNQYNQPSTRQSYRKQYVSCSPVRDYIYDGRDYTIIKPTKKNKISSGKTSSSLLSNNLSLSLSNPCLRNSDSITPVYIPHRTARFPSPSLSTDSYHTPSIIDRPSTPIPPISTYNYNKEEKEKMLISDLPAGVYQHKKEHNETMERYNRLLEKMRATDEELQSLSRSWKNNTNQRIPVSNNYLIYQQVKMDRRSNLSLNKMTNESYFLSPMFVQMCLIILIIFNLFVVYFFHEINIWWSENITPNMIMEQKKEDILNY